MPELKLWRVRADRLGWIHVEVDWVERERATNCATRRNRDWNTIVGLERPRAVKEVVDARRAILALVQNIGFHLIVARRNAGARRGARVGRRDREAQPAIGAC